MKEVHSVTHTKNIIRREKTDDVNNSCQKLRTPWILSNTILLSKNKHGLKRYSFNEWSISTNICFNDARIIKHKIITKL